jgi:predicted PurR-regulated permease PerM
MTRRLSLTLTLLCSLLFMAPVVNAQVPADLAKSFTKLTGKSNKLMGKVDPWMGMVKQNEAMIPGDVRPTYDTFNKAYEDYGGKLKLASADPSKLTSEALGSMNGDLGKLSKQFSGLQKSFKGLPFMK